MEMEMLVTKLLILSIMIVVHSGVVEYNILFSRRIINYIRTKEAKIYFQAVIKNTARKINTESI